MSSEKKQLPTGCGRLFLWFWIIGWTTFVGVFDVVTINGFYQQSQTSRFLKTEGTILSSKVQVSRDSDGGESRSAKIKYQYTVDGQSFESEMITLHGTGFSSAKDLVRKFPKGSKPIVYYNGSRPSQSVLRTGFVAADFFIFIFLTPFNAIAWVGCSFMIPIDRLPLGPYSISRSQQGLCMHYRIRQWFPLQAAGVTAGIAGFISMFVVMVLSYWISGWIPILLGATAIGVSALLGGLFLAPSTILEVDSIRSVVRLRSRDKENELEIEGGPAFKLEDNKLSLLSKQTGETLPQIDCYSNAARDWLENELKTVVRD